MKTWTKDFDMSTIPDDVLQSEHARRNARKRKSYTGGIFWKQHNPDAPHCRCKKCMTTRHGRDGVAALKAAS